jgi:glucose/arabinose dehydrogenase
MRTRGRRGVFSAVALLATSIGWLGGAPLGPAPARAAITPTLPAGFADETIVTGLNLPTAVAIAPTGRVFVAEKRGVVKTWSTYASFASNGAPTQAVDLSTDVYNYWDRGLMGLAVDPDYPTSPYIYVLYTLDAPPGKTAPYWHDACNSPANGGPGATTDGCPAQNRLERVTINTSTGVATGRSTLLTGWCQQFPSHTAGNLAFGADGDLYVTAGEGASFGPADWGQFGGTEPTIANPITPADPCGDPVDHAYLPGGAKYGLGYDTNAEGGALRAQSFRRTNGPTLLNATLLRLDKATGLGAAGNPAAASPDLNARRIVGYGFRNPFRFTFRPGTNDVWVGNVGNYNWEAIDRVPDPTAAGGPPNFGWPCREGTLSNNYYGSMSFTQCTTLALSAITGPVYEYSHVAHMTPNDTCGTGGAAVSALSFYEGTSYPPAYRQALFFGDYTRSCIGLLQATNGLPDKTKPLAFGRIPNPIQLIADPNGDLLYVDFDQTTATSGTIHRIRYQSPTPHIVASPATGPAPLGVAFNGSTSTSPVGIVGYDWDFGDGSQHGTGSTASHTYAAGGFTAKLTVTDTNGSTATVSQAIQSGTQPSVTIDSPTAATHWKVGDTIALQAHATDAYDASLPDSAYSWNVSMEHCPSDCHEHHLETLTGLDTSVDAPDHDYPSWLRVALTVTDSIGLSKTVTLDHVDPATTTVTVTSSPAGLPVTLDGAGGTSTIGPQTVIVGHQLTIGASATYTSAESLATFASWSDGGSLSHVVTAPAAPTTYTASYSRTVHDRSNTCAGAPVESAIWTYWQGQFLAAGDVDWLRFNVGAGTYRIMLGNLPQDASLELWNGCSSLRLKADLAGTHWEEIVTTLPAGTYALKVTDKGNAAAGTYAVRVTTLTSPVGITSARGIASATQVRLVGEVINLFSGDRSVTVTARLYSSTGHLLATYAIHPHVNPVPHARETFLLAVPKPSGYSKVTFSVTSTATSSAPHLLPVTSVTSAAGPPGTWTVGGSVTNTASTTATGVRAITAIFDVYGFIINATYAVVGSGTLAPHASATFHASFAVTTTVGGYRVVGQRL